MKINLAHAKWQGVGVIISIVGIFLSTGISVFSFFSKRSTAALEITQTPTLRPPVTVGKETEISYVIGGKSYKDVTIIQCTITNVGQQAIATGDFIEPLEVKGNSDFDVIAVADNLQPEGGIRSQWSGARDKTFQMKPMLVNGGEKISIVVFVSGSDKHPTTNIDIDKDLVWRARIMNVPRIRVIPSAQTIPTVLFLTWYGLVIILAGWKVHGLIIGSVVTFFVTTFLYVSGSPRFGGRSTATAIHCMGILVFSFASIEIVMFSLQYGVKTLAAICYPIIILHCAFLLYLFSPVDFFTNLAANLFAKPSRK